MITLRTPAPRGLSEQLAIVDQAEQLLDGIAPEDDRWPGLCRALFVARDAADDLRSGIAPQPYTWGQPWECSRCRHDHTLGELCTPDDEGCGIIGCCWE